MSDQELHKDYPELMSKYLSGNATDAEVQQLEAWVLDDPEHRRQFTAFKKAWIWSGMKDVQEAVDVEAQWQQTAGKLFTEPKVIPLKPSSRTYRWLGIAAAIALVGALSIWALLQWGGEREMYFITTDAIQTIDLPDGSAVTLNRSSSLQYTPIAADPENGQVARRQITLEGDAFFDVERDPDRPFVIAAGSVEVEVLGTSFYVDVRDQLTEAQVIVESGSVGVRSTVSDTLLTLSAGQKAIYEKTAESLYRQQNEDPNFQSIKTGTISFENSTLEEIAFALSRHYGVEIVYDDIEDQGNCRLNGDYEDYSLEEILEYLRSTWGVDAIQNGNRIVLSGTGCR